jgi:hypothetical protein
MTKLSLTHMTSTPNAADRGLGVAVRSLRS